MKESRKLVSFDILHIIKAKNMHISQRVNIFFITFFSVLILFMQDSYARPDILGIESRQKLDAEYFAISASKQIKHKKIFVLENPPRLVFDIERSDTSNVKMPQNNESSIVKNIRFGAFDKETTRIVFDLRDSVSSVNLHHFVAKKNKPYHMMIEIYPGKKLGHEKSSTSTSIKVSDNKKNLKKTPPITRDKKEISKNNSVFNRKTDVPLIVIDAGHGGKDPGAIGLKNQFEKHITLQYAKFLKSELDKTGRFRTLLTRDDDSFIFLANRVKKAQAAKGDIFISLHADAASTTKARGISVYTLSETASDEEAAALAKQENSADEIAGVDLMHEDEQVADILMDLARRETKNKSSDLADIMVSKFRQENIKLLPHTHRFAGFRVLKAHDIPSVLVELGFLTNPEDQKILKTEKYRRQVSKAIIAALDKYFSR